ncbi:MAG: glycerate 2-kinase [Actinomycetota bacterium]|nr:glycerate 2-kinase [Actinomycetota bacterium]
MRVRIVIAPDEFGGTLSAVDAAAAIAAGWRAAAPRDALDLAPMSDGGPGFVDVLAAALPKARRMTLSVQGPLGAPVEASYLLDGTTAYVESAQACGLHPVPPEQRDPTITTTYGVGELVAAAADAGATRLVIGLGGSATNDGGAGMIAALGGLSAWPLLLGVQLVAATDVDAPLLGLLGASAVFGPQKRATREQVMLLDARLESWADELETVAGRAVRDLPGAGAAGGLGAALFALGGSCEPGIGLVKRLVRLDQRVTKADLVVTGEGTFDFSSLSGKVASGVAAAAADVGLPCLVIAGQVTVGRRESAAAGIEATYAVADAVGVEASMAEPAEELAALAERVAREWSRG